MTCWHEQRALRPCLCLDELLATEARVHRHDEDEVDNCEGGEGCKPVLLLQEWQRDARHRMRF